MWAISGLKGGGENDSGMGRFCRKARADHERRPKDWLFKNLLEKAGVETWEGALLRSVSVNLAELRRVAP